MKTPSRNAIGSQRRFALLQRDGFACLYCGARPGNDRLHLDHVIPWSRGGSDHDRNLVTACDRCNLGKSDSISVPSSLCTGDHTADGWSIWKRWGEWCLIWTAEDGGDASLSFRPDGLDFWIALDRVHDEDWLGYMAEIDLTRGAFTSYLKRAAKWSIIRADFADAIDFARTLIRPEDGTW